LNGPSPARRPAGRGPQPGRRSPLSALRRLTAGDRDLPGAGQRRRLALAWVLALLTLLLRPWPPFQWLPGWCVGLLLLWAIAELVGWLWWPQRSA
jgi:hypothetical protein